MKQPEFRAAREAFVVHLSLARIMYGGNEDYRTSDWMRSPALKSRGLAAIPVTAVNVSVNPPQNAVELFLHRAWLSIHPKQ